MDDYIYYNNLYDCYYKLLTDKQRLYFEEYYFSNLSLGEIADTYKVSRNAVYKQLQNTIQKLIEYEEKLKILEKKEKLNKIIEIEKNIKIKNSLENLFL